MQKTVVLNVVGLTPALLGEYTPRMTAWAARGQVTSIVPTLPAVTCTAQAAYLTGKTASEHGIVAAVECVGAVGEDLGCGAAIGS
jgi:predicted AlkP superfamily pyrophosphatase or phosphodiesterase